MNVSGIDFESITDGDGVRVVIFVSGCLHKCGGCHNPLAHNFNYGKPFDAEMQDGVIRYCEQTPYVSGITLSGGDPMYSADELIPFVEEFRRRCPDKDVWCYTGCTLERDLYAGGAYHCEATDELLSLIDVLVDGEFIEEKKNLRLIFCGSENQRLIDLKKMRKAGSRNVILHELKR